jgi:hypothetical protein
LFTTAAQIAADLLDVAKSGDRAARNPFVIDAPGDYVRFMNPAFVYFEVRIAGEGEAEPDTVLLLRSRGV